MQVDESGAAVMPIGAMDESPETIYRSRDLAIVKLDARGMSQAGIARFFNIDQSTVSRRLRKVPPHVREKIARRPLVWHE